MSMPPLPQCRDFLITLVEARVLYVDFSNLQYIYSKYIYLASF